MATFLNTSAVNFYLENLIKQASERLIIISPFLRFNDRIKELLTDKDRMKIDVRIVYGKSELAPQEINWLRNLEFVRTSFCQNLHAKCYISETVAIITSMNLYDFSQVNNNEMGVHFSRQAEPDLYRETYEEAQRLIRISDQVRLSAETIVELTPVPSAQDQAGSEEQSEFNKLTTSKLAAALNLKTSDLVDRLVGRGYAVRDGRDLKLTDSGRRVGGESRFSKRFGPYLLWPREIDLK